MNIEFELDRFTDTRFSLDVFEIKKGSRQLLTTFTVHKPGFTFTSVHNFSSKTLDYLIKNNYIELIEKWELTSLTAETTICNCRLTQKTLLEIL